MRRIRIYIDEESDTLLEGIAARSGRSKAALIRDAVGERYRGASARRRDPLDALIGSLDIEPGDIGEVVYGR